MEEKTSIYDLAFNKIADMEAAINYISTLSKIYDQRMSVFIWPPQGDKGRFISVEMGFGRSGVRIFGEEGNLFIRWRDDTGQEHKEPYIDGKTVPDSIISILAEKESRRMRKKKRYAVFAMIPGDQPKELFLGRTIATNEARALKQVLSREDVFRPTLGDKAFICYFVREVKSKTIF